MTKEEYLKFVEDCGKIIPLVEELGVGILSEKHPGLIREWISVAEISFWDNSAQIEFYYDYHPNKKSNLPFSVTVPREDILREL